VQWTNPFELTSALKWTLLFAVVLLASKAAAKWLGPSGTYLAGIVAGTTDVDAITLSMAGLADTGQIAPATAVTTIYLGAASNTVVKGVMAVVAGGLAFGRRVLLAFAVILAAGGVGVLLARLL